MKKTIVLILSLFLLSTIFTSCSDAKISESVVVEQINILENQSHKYEVKLHTDIDGNEAYFYTNFRFQVGDTLVSYFQYFEEKNTDIIRVSKERDSIKKELILSNYYLQILKDRFTDTLKRK